MKILKDYLKKIIKEELNNFLSEADPKIGTGKKPKGSGRRLYTDENPSDTVSVKFRTKEDIAATINKDSFKSKPHKRQSQIINLIHQRVRAAYQNAKDPETKARLKRALEYIEKEKEQSKQKTIRMHKEELDEELLYEKCWPGYTQKGMKTMFGKRYPNCVKKKKVNEGDVIGFGTLKQRQEFRGVFAETKNAVTKLQTAPRPSKKRNTEETYNELLKNRFEAAKEVMKQAVSLAKFHLENIATNPEKMEDFYKEFYLAFMKSGFAWPEEPARIAVIKDRAIAYFENDNKTIPIQRIFGNLFPKDLAETSYDVDNLTRVLLTVAGVTPQAINEYVKIFFRDR